MVSKSLSTFALIAVSITSVALATSSDSRNAGSTTEKPPAAVTIGQLEVIPAAPGDSDVIEVSPHPGVRLAPGAVVPALPGDPDSIEANLAPGSGVTVAYTFRLIETDPSIPRPQQSVTVTCTNGGVDGVCRIAYQCGSGTGSIVTWNEGDTITVDCGSGSLTYILLKDGTGSPSPPSP